jgi:hypothetical protein
LLSVHGGAVRLILETGIDPVTGGLMQYALLAYAPAEDTDRATRPILLRETRPGVAIEVRPVLEGRFRAA